MCVLTSAGQAQPAGLFGSREIRSTNMTAFDKWSDLWRRHNLQRAEGSGDTRGNGEGLAVTAENCRGRNRIKCGRDAWEIFISEQTALSAALRTPETAQATPPTLAMLNAVNAYMNRTNYVVDPVNWGLPDYWATPDEFFLKDGDCEDYAISKYISLKRLGVNPELMRLVILQDQNLRVAHAVLVVDVDGIQYILDNQVDSVLSQDKILHYRPVYSINETAWWLHQVKRFGR